MVKILVAGKRYQQSICYACMKLLKLRVNPTNPKLNLFFTDHINCCLYKCGVRILTVVDDLRISASTICELVKETHMVINT